MRGKKEIVGIVDQVVGVHAHIHMCYVHRFMDVDIGGLC